MFSAGAESPEFETVSDKMKRFCSYVLCMRVDSFLSNFIKNQRDLLCLLFCISIFECQFLYTTITFLAYNLDEFSRSAEYFFDSSLFTVYYLYLHRVVASHTRHSSNKIHFPSRSRLYRQRCARSRESRESVPHRREYKNSVLSQHIFANFWLIS